MNIGTLKANAEGVHIGRITTLTFSATVALRAFESTNERAPKFDLMALSADRRSWVKIGALWEYSSNETGECFLSGQIDDPSLSAPIPVAMFQQNDGSFNVAWRRSKPKASLDGFAALTAPLPPATVWARAPLPHPRARRARASTPDRDKPPRDRCRDPRRSHREGPSAHLSRAGLFFCPLLSGSAELLKELGQQEGRGRCRSSKGGLNGKNNLDSRS